MLFSLFFTSSINSYKLEKMTKSLTFSNEKARKELGWEPLDVLENYKNIRQDKLFVVMSKADFDYQLVSFEESLKRVVDSLR